MKFARLGPVGAERPAVVADGRRYDLSGVAQDMTGGFLANGGPQQAASALAAEHLHDIPDAETLRVGAPIAGPGVVVCDDISERTFQLELSGGQWSKGKCSPGFTPTGPWLVTPDEVDPADLALRSWVSGEPRQDSSTTDMIFDVSYLVCHLSQFMTLEPGDLLLTGTPEGVALSGRFPTLREGDVVELEAAGLGRQRTPFGSAGAGT